jgi:PAS domain-containing protein
MRLGAALAGRPQQFEWRHRRMDGSVFEAEVSLNRFQLADGRHAVIGVVRDITQRKRQESKLRESEAQLREAQRIGRMGSWASTCQRPGDLVGGNLPHPGSGSSP